MCGGREKGDERRERKKVGNTTTKISSTIANETLDMNVGQELDINKINNAIKNFYKFNYFDDIVVKSDQGKLQLIFDEKASIANVDIIGYKQRTTDIEG